MSLALTRTNSSPLETACVYTFRAQHTPVSRPSGQRHLRSSMLAFLPLLLLEATSRSLCPIRLKPLSSTPLVTLLWLSLRQCLALTSLPHNKTTLFGSTFSAWTWDSPVPSHSPLFPRLPGSPLTFSVSTFWNPPKLGPWNTASGHTHSVSNPTRCYNSTCCPRRGDSTVRHQPGTSPLRAQLPPHVPTWTPAHVSGFAVSNRPTSIINNL